MTLQTITVAGLSTSYADAQAGDLIPVERAGVMGKQTRAQLASGVAATITKTGADAAFVTGTAGAANTTAIWNADGDLVSSGRKATGWEFLARKSGNNSAALFFTEFNNSIYEAYEFVFTALRPTATASFSWRSSSNSGVSYDFGASDYQYVIREMPFGSTTESSFANSTSQMLAGTLTAQTTHHLSGSMQVFAAGVNVATHFTWRTVFTLGMGYGAGRRQSDGQVNALEFKFDGANIDSGSITMYGLRNS